MALARDIVQAGLSGGTANALQGSVKSSISAAGTVITDATDLTASFNILGTVASGAGVQVPQLQPNESLLIYNGGANQCLVYPGASTVAINQLGVGNAMVLARFTAVIVHGISSTQVAAFLSA
jgi:hypothetical protein